MAAIVEKREEFKAKQQKILKYYEQAGDNYDFMKCEGLEGKTNKDRIEQIAKLNKELEDVKSELDSLVAIENTRRNKELFGTGNDQNENNPAFPGKSAGGAKVKTFGELFTESKAYTDKGKEVEIDCDLKTTFSTTAGWAPESVRSGRVIDYATRPIEIIDTIPSGTINQAVYKFMEETTFTDTAAEVAQGSAPTEATLALTERTQTVEKISVDIPMTDEQLEDVSGAQSYLNNRLSFMLRRRYGYQLINGDGSTPNLLGMLNKSGIQSFVASGDLFDDIAEAIRMVAAIGFADASAIYVNHADWWSSKLRLKRDDNGNYILGGPTDPNATSLWGVRVIPCHALASGTIITADTMGYMQTFEKRGITFKITDSHASEFRSGVQRVRADMRVVFVIFRAAAICKITNC